MSAWWSPLANIQLLGLYSCINTTSQVNPFTTISSTTNMGKMIHLLAQQIWEFSLGLLVFVTETSDCWDLSIQISSNQQGVKPFLPRSLSGTWMALQGLPRADDISWRYCGLPACQCHILEVIIVYVAWKGFEFKKCFFTETYLTKQDTFPRIPTRL